MKQGNIAFLKWLSNRLVYKHKYQPDSAVIDNLSKIISFEEQEFKLDISQNELDLVISKYHVDFFLDKIPELNIGYNDTERERVREQTKLLVMDIVNHNVPTGPIIEGPAYVNSN